MSAPAGLENRNHNHNQYPNLSHRAIQNEAVDDLEDDVRGLRLAINPNIHPEIQPALQGFSLASHPNNPYGLSNANLASALSSSANPSNPSNQLYKRRLLKNYSKHGMSIIDKSDPAISAAILQAPKPIEREVLVKSHNVTDNFSIDDFTTLRSLNKFEINQQPTQGTIFIQLGRRLIRHSPYAETNTYVEDNSLYKGKAITLPKGMFDEMYKRMAKGAAYKRLGGYIFKKSNGVRVIFDPPMFKNGFYMLRVLEDNPFSTTVKNKPYNRPSVNGTKRSSAPKTYGGTRRGGSRNKTKRSKRR